MAGIFSDWQPRYAEAGIATFPVRSKKPAVKGYLKAGLRASNEFRTKFPDDDAFGFACRPSRITVLDVDSPDERLLCDALSEFGPTPIIIRSGSGNHQAWYRHDGERRRVRPDPSRPIDILGDGFVVAPPSVGSKRHYQLIQGSLADLHSLPPMRKVEVAEQPAPFVLQPTADLIEVGQRNETLWRACMVRARSCHRIEELMEFAVQYNSQSFYEPLPDSEVLRVVASAWSKQLSGDNWFGIGKRLILKFDDIDRLVADPDAFALLALLRRHHDQGKTFVVANAMAEVMPGGSWSRKRFASARARLEEMGELQMITYASRQNGPARYRFKGGR